MSLLALGWVREVEFSALHARQGGGGGRAEGRKGEEERHLHVFFRAACLPERPCATVPGFVFDHDAALHADFVAEPGDEVRVAAWEAHGQDGTRWGVGEGDGEVAEGGEGAEIGEGEAEVLEGAGEVGC